MITRYPPYGTLVSDEFARLASLGLEGYGDNSVRTIWEKQWENPPRHVVASKACNLNGDVVTDITLHLVPATAVQVEQTEPEQTEPEQIEPERTGQGDKTKSPSNLTFMDLLLATSKTKEGKLVVGSKVYREYQSYSKKDGSGWIGGLQGFSEDGKPWAKEVSIDFGNYILIKELGGGVELEGGGYEFVVEKVFTEVGDGKYEVSIITDRNNRYKSPVAVDINGVVLAARKGDTLGLDGRNYTVDHKIFAPNRASPEYVKAYLGLLLA